MKKYLMTGIAALAMCFGFTSCSHDVDPVSQEDLNQLEAQKIVNNYNQAFIKTFGQPAANQTWGFGGYATTRAYTRGEVGTLGMVLKHDEVANGYPIEREPAPLVEAHDGYKSEKDYVTEWFQNNPGLTENGLDIHNFFIQYVNGDWSNKEGDWHFIDAANNIDEYKKFTANGGMDKLLVGANSTQYVHTNDFNEKSGGPFGVLYVKDGSAMKFGYHSSWGEDSQSPDGTGNYWYFKLARIDVPGVGVGYYVGLSLYGKKAENGVKELGTTRLQYAEDWILKIVPDEPIPDPDPDNVCIIAEDLSANDATDFDFNDVVFTVEYTSTTTAKVTLYAAGGTLPLTVAGTEVHQAFGYGDPDENGLYKMINTGAKANVNGVAPVVLFESLTVDKSKRGNDIKIMVDKGKKNDQGVYVPNWIELTATGGEPAAKLCVGTDYATDPAGPKWCAERESIKTKYPAFSEWVANSPTLIWWK